MLQKPDTSFSANGLPILIGSLPMSSHKKALDLIFSSTPDIPLWPQLPGNPYEHMMPQFAEGSPCIVEEDLNKPEGRILFDDTAPDFDDKMLSFYEDYMAVLADPALLENSRFKVNRDRAEGLYLLAETLKDRTAAPLAVKGQVTGPFTMLTGIKDRAGRAGYFNDIIREMMIKSISMKAAWQTQLLAGASGTPVLMFIDEPALAGLGSSAFISVTAAEIQEMINEVTDAIHQAGGLAAVHVCANTEWETLLESQIDIISFDAYGFFDKFSPLKQQINKYLDRGGIIAWGGIPTGEATDIEKESSDSLTALWEKQAEVLTGPNRSIESLLRQTLITPSCGTGSLKLELAEKVALMTKDVSAKLRAKYLIEQ